MRPSLQYGFYSGTFAHFVQIKHSFFRISFFSVSYAGFRIVQIKLCQTYYGPWIFYCWFHTIYAGFYSGVYAFFIQISCFGIILATRRSDYLSVVGSYTAVLCCQKSGYPFIAVGALGIPEFMVCISFIIRAAFIVAVFKGYPCIKTGLTVHVHIQCPFSRFGISRTCRNGDNLQLVFWVESRIFVNR